MPNSDKQMRRYAMVIEVKKEKIDLYKGMHANPIPQVAELIKKKKITNYSIYLAEITPDKYYLFGYMEYYGDDLERDLAEPPEDPVLAEWLGKCSECHSPLETRKEGENWNALEEVFHND